MKRRNFLLNLLLWILSFIFGYRVGNSDTKSGVSSEGLVQTAKRTAQSVNVREFGVIEDDGNDYTVELQNAINYACENGVVLESNGGTVRISGNGLYIWNPIIWKGFRGKVYGQKPLVLLYTGTGSALTFWKRNTANGTTLDEEKNQMGSIFLSDINIQRTFSSDATYSEGYGEYGIGFDLHRVSESRFERCSATGFKAAYHLQGVSITEFIKCDVVNNTYGVWMAKGRMENDGNSFSNNKNKFEDCNWWINKEACVVTGSGYQNSFINCHMEISTRAFYLPITATNKLLDTLIVDRLNYNYAGSSTDDFYAGNFPRIPDARFIEITVENSTVAGHEIYNFIVKNSRIKCVSDKGYFVKYTGSNNVLATHSIILSDNYILGTPNGIINSDSTSLPNIVMDGLNTFRTKANNDDSLSAALTRNTGGKVVGSAYGYIYSEEFTPTKKSIRETSSTGAAGVAPLFKGEIIYSTNDLRYYMANDTTTSSWQPLTYRYRDAGLSPVGRLTPQYIGEEYLDTVNKIWYKSVGTTNTDWKQITN